MLSGWFSEVGGFRNLVLLLFSGVCHAKGSKLGQPACKQDLCLKHPGNASRLGCIVGTHQHLFT